jgi:hypothetical protein
MTFPFTLFTLSKLSGLPNPRSQIPVFVRLAIGLLPNAERSEEIYTSHVLSRHFKGDSMKQTKSRFSMKFMAQLGEETTCFACDMAKEQCQAQKRPIKPFMHCHPRAQTIKPQIDPIRSALGAA